MTTYSIVHSHLESERGREIAGDRQTDRPFGGLRRRGTWIFDGRQSYPNMRTRGDTR